MDYAATILSRLPGASRRDKGLRQLVETLDTYLSKEQVEKVVLEILGWHAGYFRFDELDMADCGEVEVDGQDLIINGDLNDLRLYSEEQSRTNIEAFVEQLTK